MPRGIVQSYRARTNKIRNGILIRTRTINPKGTGFRKRIRNAPSSTLPTVSPWDVGSAIVGLPNLVECGLGIGARLRRDTATHSFKIIIISPFPRPVT
jgi:hypothetical protein